MELAAIILVIVVALGFDYTNGFHDAANAIATSVSTRALAPRTALIMAAVMYLVGAFLGTAVATTVGSGIIDAPTGIPGLVVVLWWVILLSAGALSAGTYSGGWRIMRTLGRRIIDLDPPRGFAAEATASAVLYTTAFAFAAPISTTQTITSSILGVGATKRLSAVRWTVAGNIAVAWVVTLPAAALCAAVTYWLLHLVFVH